MFRYPYPILFSTLILLLNPSSFPVLIGYRASLSTMTDYTMDFAVEKVADELIDQVGGNFTQSLYEQMKRNYNID